MSRRYQKRVTDEDIAKIHIKSLPTKHLLKIMEFISALKEWRSKEKLYSTYYKGIKKALDNTNNGKVFFDYRLEGTVTGRLSCGAYKASKRIDNEEN